MVLQSTSTVLLPSTIPLLLVELLELEVYGPSYGFQLVLIKYFACNITLVFSSPALAHFKL